jgi:pheromone a factor receptor
MPHYFQLMAVAATQVLFTLPVTVYEILSHFRLSPPKLWISWADVHKHVGQVRFIQQEEMMARPLRSSLRNLDQWFTVGEAFWFFMFFGLSSEARQWYIQTFWRISAPLGLKPPAPKPEDSGQ